MILHVDIEDSDQTEWIPKLIILHRANMPSFTFGCVPALLVISTQ